MPWRRRGNRQERGQVTEFVPVTTHTPVQAGHDCFLLDLVGRVLGDVVDREITQKLAGGDGLNAIRLALDLREYINGVDVWRNTPESPLEISGTSGMTAATNGVPSFSVLDGWWLEGRIEGVTGWSIAGGDADDGAGNAASLYSRLENVVLPLCRDREAWVAVIKGGILFNPSILNSRHTMRRCAVEAHLR